MVIGSDPGRVPSGVTLDNWQEASSLHWSFQHLDQIVPVLPISRGLGPIAWLASAPTDLSDIVVTHRHPHLHHHAPAPAAAMSDAAHGLAHGLVDEAVHGLRPRTVGEIMQMSATDGWIVVRDGAVLHEEYAGGMQPHTQHILMSVSKSLVATVTGALVGRGVIDVDAPVAAYVPLLASTGYDGATVRHLLDMRTGIAFNEDYLDPDAEVRVLEEAIDWAPRRTPGVPATMYEFLLTLQAKGPHGGPFEYKSCETDVLGWVCEAATGARMPELMSDLLWSRIGAEFDASIGVDSVGTGMFDGGVCAALRDLARFGVLMLQSGVSLTGEQVVPESWVSDTFDGGPDSREAFAASSSHVLMPGGMYRNQFWFPSADPDVALCLGIHGQIIYINRRARVVGAKLSSWPTPQDSHRLYSTIDAFDAIARELGG